MREIRFRVWDKTTKIMSIDMSLNFLSNYANNLNDCFLHFAIKKGLDVMQFIGLKDKNGVDIFEGDIINNGDLCVVEWRDIDVCFVLMNKEHEGYGFFETDDGTTSNYEVIGNIYENSELLISLPKGDDEK